MKGATKVTIDIIKCFRERAPISTQLNAVDLYLVVSIFLVLSALLEYAVILLLLKKRRKPKSPWTIDAGLRKVRIIVITFNIVEYSFRT